MPIQIISVHRFNAPREAPESYQAFISYTTREDEVRIVKPHIDAFIDAFRKEIRQIEREIKVLLFYDYLRIGQMSNPWRIGTELNDGIKRSLSMIAFISPHYLTSEWCRFEWQTMDREHESCGDNSWKLPVVWKPTEDLRKFLNGNLFYSMHDNGKLSYELTRDTGRIVAHAFIRMARKHKRFHP